MTPTGIILTILIGVVVGFLGRLVVPGRQPIGFLITIVVGIVAAFIGAFLAPKLGIPTGTSGPIDWILLLVQVVIAAIGVAIAAAVMGRRGTGSPRR